MQRRKWRRTEDGEEEQRIKVKEEGERDEEEGKKKEK